MLRLRLIINALQLLPVQVWNVAINENIMAHEQEFAYVVSVQYNNQDPLENSHCTGMILSPWWVSTSCLCLRKVSRKEPSAIAPPHKFRIIFGTCINTGSIGKLRFPMIIREHEACNIREKSFDFAVMSVTYQFHLNDFRSGLISVLPVSSQEPSMIMKGFSALLTKTLLCTVIGWVGNSSIVGSHNQLTLDVAIVEASVCDVILCTMVPSVCNKKKVSAKQLGLICGRAKHATPCEGFQGAPLVCGSNVWATASLMNRCGNELVTNNFVIFTRIDIGYEFLRSYAISVAIRLHHKISIPITCIYTAILTSFFTM